MRKRLRPLIPVAPRWFLVVLLAGLAVNAQGPGTASISGTVRLASGEPVPNAQLWLLPPSVPLPTPGYLRAQTDEQGRFVLQNVQSGDLHFFCARRAPGAIYGSRSGGAERAPRSG